MAPLCRPLLFAFWATSALPAPLAGQGDPPTAAPEHGLKIQQEYDGPRDTTTVALILDKGRHFIRWHRPRVTVIFQYSGRTPRDRPESLVIEFRTQSPQYTSTNVLTITTSVGDRLTVSATGSRGYQRVQTTDHTLIFTLPTADLDALLGAFEGEMEVGGVRVRLERRHFLGLAALLQRVTPAEHSLTPSNQRMQQSGARAPAPRRAGARCLGMEHSLARVGAGPRNCSGSCDGTSRTPLRLTHGVCHPDDIELAPRSFWLQTTAQARYKTARERVRLLVGVTGLSYVVRSRRVQ